MPSRLTPELTSRLPDHAASWSGVSGWLTRARLLLPLGKCVLSPCRVPGTGDLGAARVDRAWAAGEGPPLRPISPESGFSEDSVRPALRSQPRGRELGCRAGQGTRPAGAVESRHWSPSEQGPHHPAPANSRHVEPPACCCHSQFSSEAERRVFAGDLPFLRSWQLEQKYKLRKKKKKPQNTRTSHRFVTCGSFLLLPFYRPVSGWIRFRLSHQGHLSQEAPSLPAMEDHTPPPDCRVSPPCWTATWE